MAPSESRHWRDIFWLAVFIIHLAILGFVLAVLGLNRFKVSDRLNIDRYTEGLWENRHGLTETFWPMYALAGGVGTVLAWIWLLLLGSHVNQMMKVSVHILTTYLAVISVLCFWCNQFFWGVAFAIAAAIQFLYVIAVIDRYTNFLNCVCVDHFLWRLVIGWLLLIFLRSLFSKLRRWMKNLAIQGLVKPNLTCHLCFSELKVVCDLMIFVCPVPVVHFYCIQEFHYW